MKVQLNSIVMNKIMPLVREFDLSPAKIAHLLLLGGNEDQYKEILTKFSKEKQHEKGINTIRDN